MILHVNRKMSTVKFLETEVDVVEQQSNLISPPKRTPPIVYVYIILAAMANFLFGYENSNVSGAKIAFANDYHINKDSSAYGFIAAAMATGATISCPFAGLLQDHFGRFGSIFHTVENFHA